MAGMAYDELIDRLTLQEANIGTYGTTVGATPAEIADIAADRANLEYAGPYAEVVSGNKKTVTQIKQALFNGHENVDLAAYPEFAEGSLPAPGGKAGAYQRYVDAASGGKRLRAGTPT